MCGANPWPAGIEPSLDDLLSDPIAVALRRSDGLTRRSIEAVLARAAAARRMLPAAMTVHPMRLAPAHDASHRPVTLEFDFDAEPELTLSD